MSYARFAEDSDVYVFLSAAGSLECCSCRLKETGACATFTTTGEMLAHLNDHAQAGHDVPGKCCDRLTEEREEIDTWLASEKAVSARQKLSEWRAEANGDA